MPVIMALAVPDVAASSASTSSTAQSNPIAELKNGKVIFRQKPISFEKASETMQEIVKFREMLNTRVQNQDQPLVVIPDEHRPLIVKLAQESDKGVVPLAKQIRSTLLPSPGETEDTHRLSLESNLPISVVEDAIKAVMTRTNYGLDGYLGQKLPAALCVWRWEVKDTYKEWLPKSARDNADSRLAERMQANADLRTAFQSLSQAERDSILDPKGVLKHPTKDTNRLDTTIVSLRNEQSFSREPQSKDEPIDETDGEVLLENLAPKGRVKKAVDSEKVVKIKDKEEKRMAKVEKEKKQKEAQDKSRSILANFFGKAKHSVLDSPTKDPSVSAAPSVESEFQRSFKPFVLKKDAELAPLNWFLEGKKRSCDGMTGVSHEEAIVIDDDISMQIVQNPGALSDSISTPVVDSPGNLRVFVAELRQKSIGSCPRTRRATSLKTYDSRSVRDTTSQLNDAEIAGDPTQVRYLLSVLRDRRVFPAKVFIFHEDLRPGYYGTWTRNSRIVGPRTPLERDVLVRDYGYDSGEEWEDEGPGDADDVVEDGEDDEADADGADSDVDSWLVDDDDEIRSPLDLDDLSPPPLDVSIPPPKRKAENNEKRSEKKRKVVVPLVPYVKGPVWESYVGHCEYDPFSVYRIQLLNDTPYPIDPFTFTSVITDESRKSQSNTSSTVPFLIGADSMASSSTTKRTVSSAPKTVFPVAYLGALLEKITELATPNLTFLVESIYQELRVHKVKKNAIEAKVREMSEKSKEKKIWVVKETVQASRHHS